MKIAIPCANGMLCMHFGHCQQFALIDVEGGQVVNKEMVDPPPHQPGLLPEWLGGLGVNEVIAGGMGVRARDLFEARGIKVTVGAPAVEPEKLVAAHLNGTLETGDNICDH